MTNPESAPEPEIDIVSSTGRPGVWRRSYDRLYANATRISDDPDEVEINFQRIVSIGNKFSSRIGRVVFKGIVNNAVRLHIDNSQLVSALEVALPLGEFGQPGDHLVYLANNQPEREPLVSITEMVNATEPYSTKNLDTTARIETLMAKGFSFTNLLTGEDFEAVHELWGPTFNWTKTELAALADRLNIERSLEATQRTVWYSALKKDGVVVSVAMAERLQMPTSIGEIDIVESTEWRVRDGYGGQGLMTSVLVHLNAQILADFYRSQRPVPLVIAECNFQSRSDRAGYGAGFRIPVRGQGLKPPAQILVQNVAVGDGQDWPADKLRDFSFMYLPIDQITSNYSQAQVTKILTAAS